MSGPDGPEEREAWLEERLAADLDRLDLAESLADEYEPTEGDDA